jgi:(2Fe-2S) ferredoxin
VVIYPEGTWYSVPTQEDVLEIVQTHLVKGEIVPRLLMPPPYTREKKEP